MAKVYPIKVYLCEAGIELARSEGAAGAVQAIDAAAESLPWWAWRRRQAFVRAREAATDVAIRHMGKSEALDEVKG